MSAKSNKKRQKQDVKPTVKTENGQWTNENTNMLMTRIQMNLPKPDTLKYTSMLDKLVWDKVSFDGFTADDCKRKWAELSREVRKYRTLSELVIDAKEYLRDPYKGQIKKHPDYPKRPLTPYFRFFMEKRDSFAEKHKEMTNLEVTAVLSKKYRALPTKKKERYLAEWKKETVNFQITMKKFKEDHPDYFSTGPTKPPEPHTPMIIYKEEYYEEYARKHSELSKKECSEALKKKYKSLSDEKKQKYIEKALREQQEYKVAMDKYLESNPDVPKKTTRTILNKYERKLNDKSIGKPEKPPSNGYNLFCTETMPTLNSTMSQNRIIECGRLWNLKSPEEKQQYQNRYLQLKNKYKEDYKTFYNTLSVEEKTKEKELVKPKKRQTANSVGSTSTVGKIIKVEPPESTTEESSDDDDDEDISEQLHDSSDDDDDSDDSDDDEDDNDDDETSDETGKPDKDNEEEVLNKMPDLAPARPTTPISALFLYQKAHRRKVEAQYPHMSSDEITRLLARRYHELPEHKRHKYVQKEKEQRAIYNEKMQQCLKAGLKKNGVEPAKEKPVKPQAVTGEQLYHEKCAVHFNKKYKTKEEVEAALRTSWKKFSKARREPYIKAAQELNQKNIATYQEAILSNESNKENTSYPKESSVQTKVKSVIGKKLKFAGEPKRPPLSGYQLFSATYLSKLSHLSQNERFKEIGRMWKELDASKKQTFTNQAKKNSEKYKKELENWLKKLPHDVAAQYLEQQSKKRSKKPSVEAPAEKKAKIASDASGLTTKEDDESSSSDSAAESDSSSDDDSDDSSSASSDSDEEDSSNNSSSSSSDEDSSSSQSE